MISLSELALHIIMFVAINVKYRKIMYKLENGDVDDANDHHQDVKDCLHNGLTDGGKVVSLMHRPHFTPQKHHYFSVSGTHVC
jgi:hypothetical protein